MDQQFDYKMQIVNIIYIHMISLMEVDQNNNQLQHIKRVQIIILYELSNLDKIFQANHSKTQLNVTIPLDQNI